jgi:hypothetical protein
VIDAADVAALRDHLRHSPLLGAEQLPFCSVIGEPSECTIRTLTVLRRALAGLGPTAAQMQTCTAAQPL